MRKEEKGYTGIKEKQRDEYELAEEGRESGRPMRKERGLRKIQ